MHVGERALPGAAEALARLRASGLPHLFLTNTTRVGASELAARLRALGLAVEAAQIFGAPAAARRLVLARGLRPHLLVHPRLRPELADLEGEPADSVLIGDAGEAFSYAALNRAYRVLAGGAPLIALARNRYFQEEDGPSLDAGPFVAALEHAAGIEAELVGKPARAFFAAAAAQLGVALSEAVMIGDDVESDVLGALAHGLQAVLVETGKHRPGDSERARAAGASVATDLAAALAALLA